MIIKIAIAKVCLHNDLIQDLLFYPGFFLPAGENDASGPMQQHPVLQSLFVQVSQVRQGAE
jgi:hypothetical protein